MSDILRQLDEVRHRVDGLLATWSDGRMLREGALVVIAGRPNVGKSTLMNVLLGQNRAIVSDTPGTTRDTIEEGYVLNGIPLRLVDTAGLRETDCDIEREGIRRSHDHLEKADATLYLIDAQGGASTEDLDNLDRLPADRCLVIWNKMDLANERPSLNGRSMRELHTSLKTGNAVADVRSALADLLHTGYRQGADQQAVISERHRSILLEFQRQLNMATERIGERNEDQIPLACSHLRDGLEALGMATGRVYHQELLNSIFSRFCIGK